MNDSTAKFVGMFSGIHFAVKQKKGEMVQTAGLNFEVELDETSVGQVTGVIGWQKQLVAVDISRRQPSLFGEKPQPQGKLPLSGRNGDGPDAPPAPADPSMATDALTEGTWMERGVVGEDGQVREILVRNCGLRFLCVECGDGSELDPGDVLEDELRKHDCSAPADEILLDKSELSQLEATLKVPCKDGITREFSYELTCWRAKQGPALICGECDDVIEIPEREAEEKILPMETMAAHVCPPVCHKCHAEMEYGAVFAERLRFHHPECPQAKLHDPEVAVATALDVLGADPYATSVEAALDVDAREFILEDATEAFARIEEECGMTRSVGRKDRNEYKAAHALSKKDRKAVLAAVKKASKPAWNRMEVLLRDIDAAHAVHAAIAKEKQREDARIREEERKRDNQERDQEERERIAEVLAGEPQPYDEMLRKVLYRDEKTQRNWIAACERGRDNPALRMMIMQAFGQGKGDNVSGQTSISWQGGYNPRFWVGPATGTPTLEGDELTDQVRRIMRIPAPIAEEDPEAEGVRECRICGCSDFNPCVEGCAWVETDLCSNPDCLETADYTPEQIAKIASGETLPLADGAQKGSP